MPQKHLHFLRGKTAATSLGAAAKEPIKRRGRTIDQQFYRLHPRHPREDGQSIGQIVTSPVDHPQHEHLTALGKIAGTTREGSADRRRG